MQMQDRTDAVQVGCWSGRMQDRMDAGKDRFSTGQIQEESDAKWNTHYRNIQMQDRKDTEHIPGQKIISKQDGCSTGRPLKRTNSGQDRCRTDEKQDRSNAGKEIYCTLQDGCKTC